MKLIKSGKIILALVLSLPTGYAGAAQTTSVSIRGHVSQTNCRLTIPATVNLGALLRERLPATGDGGGSAPHYGVQMVDVSLDQCQAGQQYSLTVMGTPNSHDPGALANTSTGSEAAEYVAVSVWDGLSRLLSPNVTRSRTYMIDAAGHSTIQLGFVAVKTGAAPTNGVVSSTGQIRIDYL